MHLSLVHLELLVEKRGKGMKQTGSSLNYLGGKKGIRKNIDVIIWVFKESRQ